MRSTITFIQRTAAAGREKGRMDITSIDPTRNIVPGTARSFVIRGRSRQATSEESVKCSVGTVAIASAAIDIAALLPLLQLALPLPTLLLLHYC